jgi:hypothetical protein
MRLASPEAKHRRSRPGSTASRGSHAGARGRTPRYQGQELVELGHGHGEDVLCLAHGFPPEVGSKDGRRQGRVTRGKGHKALPIPPRVTIPCPPRPAFWYESIVRQAFFLPMLVLAMTVACGGAQPPKTSGAAGGLPNGSDDRNSTAGEPKLPSCDDGSCFRCGDGICPTGFYCESNGGVTGCQWSPACARTPTCRCLESSIKADPRCGCEDRNGVAFVTCSK